MNNLRVIFSVIIILILATACKKNPATTSSEPLTATIVDTQSAQPETQTATPTAAIPTATPQASPTPPPATDEPVPPTPTASAVEAAVTATSTSTGPPCLDEAVFVGDLTIPDGTIFRPGEAFTKTWRVKNTGTCIWGSGYSLIYTSGDIMNGEFGNPIRSTSPGELVDVSVDLVAPSRGGEQTGYWQFQNANSQAFGVGYNGGDPMWVKINVTFFNPNPQPTAVVILSEPLVGPAPTPISPPQVVPSPEDSSSSSTGCTPQQNDTYVNDMLSLINQARAENNLQPVFLQSQLSAAALKHSIDMACNQIVDHHGSNGSTWYSRVEAEGYANPRSARENIKVGTNVQDSFNWWMGSQIHRENILFPSVTEAGIGYVFVPGSPYGSYFTLVLARR